MRPFRLILLSALGAVALPAADKAPVLPAPPDEAAVRALFESMKPPVPPRRLVGNIHSVGTSGVCCYLITTREGHILLDTGFADTVPGLVENIAALGFKPADIKFILSSHAHTDHVGGHAEMKRLTGAQVVATSADRAILESGGAADPLPWPRAVMLYEKVAVDRTVPDRGTVSLGGVTLTAVLTPGHTKGATTWTMKAEEDGKTYDVVFISSMTVNQGARLKLKPTYPGIADDFATAFIRLKSLPCDIFFAPHGNQWDQFMKFEALDAGKGVEALVDKDGWRNLIGLAEYSYRRQLRDEEAAAKAAK